VLRRLKSQGVGLIYISHRLGELPLIADRVTALRDGRLAGQAPIADVSRADLIRMMVGRELSAVFPKTAAPIGEVLLEARRLSCRAGGVHDVSFSVRAGEVVGMAGLVGAGRTELARILAGADHADSGVMEIDGCAVSLRSPADAIAQGIGLLPEDRKAQGFVGGFTIARNVALPHLRRLASAGWLPPRCEAALAASVVGELRIKGTPSQPVRLLSGGNQQKVVLGKWLAGDARIFIFDEPTRGVDVGAKVEIYGVMNRLTAAGAGIIMISSELPELLGMSGRILVMHGGRIRAEFGWADATEERVLSAALGLAS
jgi:ABC-type sugar transport system ATPase subunit